jgi:hypothetical protein
MAEKRETAGTQPNLFQSDTVALPELQPTKEPDINLGPDGKRIKRHRPAKTTKAERGVMRGNKGVTGPAAPGSFLERKDIGG